MWIDADTHEDGWGVRHRIGAGGWYEEWATEPEDFAERVARLKAEEKFVSGGIANPGGPSTARACRL